MAQLRLPFQPPVGAQPARHEYADKFDQQEMRLQKISSENGAPASSRAGLVAKPAREDAGAPPDFHRFRASHAATCTTPPKIVWSSAFRRLTGIIETDRLKAELQTSSSFQGVAHFWPGALS